MSRRYTLPAGLCCCLLVIFSHMAFARANGHVIARVGSQEITDAELEDEFRRAALSPDKRSDQLTRRILGDLVKRKYFAQRATATGLDKKPNIQSEIARSREQVLAAAYLQSSAAMKASDIGPRQIDQFITDHPLKFAKRTIVEVDQITVPIEGDMKAMVDATNNLRTLEDIDKQLVRLGIAHAQSPGILDSANMPDELFSAIEAKKGEIIFVRFEPTKGTFFKVRSESNLPVRGDEATNLAKRMLMSKILQDEANAPPSSDIEIKYEGDYARLMNRPAPDQPDGAMPK